MGKFSKLARYVNDVKNAMASTYHVPVIGRFWSAQIGEEQAAYAAERCTFGKDTAVIAHSFGGVVAMRLLESGYSMGKLVLVSTPFTGKTLDNKKRPTVLAACEKGFVADAINRNCPDITLIYDTHDHVVPLSEGKGLAELLGAPLYEKRACKSHFNGERERDILALAVPAVRVFTTRPDRLSAGSYPQ
jgi:predicted alpha/beta hydrolase family esterase